MLNGDLTPAERYLADCASAGVQCDLAPHAAESGTALADVRAQVVRNLLRGELRVSVDGAVDEQWTCHPRGVDALNIRVVGDLDLSRLDGLKSLILASCQLETIDLTGAEIPTVRLSACAATAIRAAAARIAGEAVFTSCDVAEKISFVDAELGRVVVRECRVGAAGAQGPVLDARRATLTGPLRILGGPGQPVELGGYIELTDANVGDFHVTWVVVTGTHTYGCSIEAGRLRVGGGVLVNDVDLAGGVRLTHAEVTGDIDVHGGILGANHAGRSLLLDGAKVTGSLWLDGSASSVSLRLTGCLRLADSRFRSVVVSAVSLGADENADSLPADRVKVHGDLVIGGAKPGNRANLAGVVRVAGARVEGDVAMVNIDVGANGNRESLYADSLWVGGHARLGPGFRAGGTVRLAGTAVMRGLRMRGIRIEGANRYGTALYADDLTTGGPLTMGAQTDWDGASSLAPPAPEEHFSLAGSLRLARARLGGLDCGWGRVEGKDAVGDSVIAHAAQIAGDLVLGPELHLVGAIHLASVSAAFVWNSGLTVGVNGHDVSVVGDAMSVASDAIFSGGPSGSDGHVSGLLVAQGSVRLPGARIGGRLSLRGSRLGRDKHGGSLFADALRVTGDMDLDGAAHRAPGGSGPDGGGPDGGVRSLFEAAGALRLPGARILGDLSLLGVQLTGANQDGNAIMADHVHVRGHVRLGAFHGQPFRAAGTVRIAHATLGTLAVGDGAIEVPTPARRLAELGVYAFRAHGTKVGGRMQFGPRLTVVGSMSMAGATTAGIVCEDVAVTGHRRQCAVNAENVVVDGEVKLSSVVARDGAVRLFGAQVKSTLWVIGCTFLGHDGFDMALVLDAARVTGDAAFMDVAAAGRLALRGLRVEGTLRVDYREVGKPVEGCPSRLSYLLDGSYVSVLHDVFPTSVTPSQLRWRDRRDGLPGVEVDLVGFRYNLIHHLSPDDVRLRMRWLRSGVDRSAFHPQSYGQLITVYRDRGDNAAARCVAVEQMQRRRQDLRRRAGSGGVPGSGRNALIDGTARRWFQQSWYFLTFVTVGYGYRPWRAVAWAVAVVSVFASLVFVAEHKEIMVPAAANRMVTTERAPGLAAPGSGPPASGTITAEFGCSSDYPCLEPFGYAADVFIPFVDLDQEATWRPDTTKRWGACLRVVQWTVVGLGWLLTTIVVAALTGMVRSDHT